MSNDLGMLLRTASYLAFEDGTNDYTTPALAAARIAKLEAALRNIAADCEDDCPPSYGAIKYAARAALAGGKDE